MYPRCELTQTVARGEAGHWFNLWETEVVVFGASIDSHRDTSTGIH